MMSRNDCSGSTFSKDKTAHLDIGLSAQNLHSQFGLPSHLEFKIVNLSREGWGRRHPIGRGYPAYLANLSSVIEVTLVMSELGA